MIGEHDPKASRNTDLVEAVTVGLDEAFTALEESLYDLTDEQVQLFPVRGRNNIAWIIMHALQNLDTYANAFQTGETVFTHEERWDLWRCSEDQRPKSGDLFPPKKEMMDILSGVRNAAMEGIAVAEEADLRGSRAAEKWWGERTSADAYLRTIYHTMAHVRQIWLLQGALGIIDGKSWPRQHWAQCVNEVIDLTMQPERSSLCYVSLGMSGRPSQSSSLLFLSSCRFLWRYL